MRSAMRRAETNDFPERYGGVTNPSPPIPVAAAAAAAAFGVHRARGSGRSRDRSNRVFARTERHNHAAFLDLARAASTRCHLLPLHAAPNSAPRVPPILPPRLPPSLSP